MPLELNAGLAHLVFDTYHECPSNAGRSRGRQETRTGHGRTVNE